MPGEDADRRGGPEAHPLIAPRRDDGLAVRGEGHPGHGRGMCRELLQLHLEVVEVRNGAGSNFVLYAEQVSPTASAEDADRTAAKPKRGGS